VSILPARREGERSYIIFSQYFDTASWVAQRLAAELPKSVPIGIYAGLGKSGIWAGGEFSSTSRDQIKDMVRERRLQLLVATDAACEGLNLQTLGTLINIDLPWNPSRLEQRLGRIKRFGQARDRVGMLNLVYQGTRDEQIYAALSARMADVYDIFGSLPDTIEDEWIDDITTLNDRLATFTTRRDTAANAFDLRYEAKASPKDTPWEKCEKVLARRDIVQLMSKGW
jgi:superfamily II DNA/RNA helicase